MNSIKDVVRSSVKVPVFDKYLKKAGGHIGRNVVEISIKMNTIVRKFLMIKHGLWLKFFSSFVAMLAKQLTKCANKKLEKYIRILKYPRKGTIPSNYRLITCLTITGKIKQKK